MLHKESTGHLKNITDRAHSNSIATGDRSPIWWEGLGSRDLKPQAITNSVQAQSWLDRRTPVAFPFIRASRLAWALPSMFLLCTSEPQEKPRVDESVNKLASLCRNLANTTVQGLSKFVIY